MSQRPSQSSWWRPDLPAIAPRSSRLGTSQASIIQYYDPRSPQSTPKSDDLIPPKPRIAPKQLARGAIAYLPVWTQNGPRAKCVKCGKNLNPKGYNHPCVVLDYWQAPGSQVIGDLVVRVTEVGTMHNTDIQTWLEHREEEKFRNSIPIFQNLHLPIKRLHDTQAKFEADLREYEQAIRAQELVPEYLYLDYRAEEKVNMEKQSFSVYTHALDIPMSTIYKYSYKDHTPYRRRLTEESYVLLCQKLGLEPGVYEDIQYLVADGPSRLSALLKVKV